MVHMIVKAPWNDGRGRLLKTQDSLPVRVIRTRPWTQGWLPSIRKEKSSAQHLHPKAQPAQHLQPSVVEDGQHQTVHEHHTTEALDHMDDEVAWR